MFAEATLVIQPEVRALCVKPYPNHPRGCPNFGKKRGCPPSCRLVTDVIDLSKPTFVIWNEFAFGAHVARMRSRYPQWSQRQVECCLYWQPTARKNLKLAIDEFRTSNAGLWVTTCPEAMGVNVTATMLGIGVLLEWPPMTKTYQVAIAGTLVRTPSRQ